MLDVAVYEENNLMRTLIHEWLTEAGYRIRLRDTPHDRHPDLVILSVYMPKRAGALWIRAIRAAHPLTPLIAISGQFRSGLSAAGATARNLGVQRVIAKPLMRHELLEAVRGMIGTPEQCAR